MPPVGIFTKAGHTRSIRGIILGGIDHNACLIATEAVKIVPCQKKRHYQAKARLCRRQDIQQGTRLYRAETNTEKLS